MTPVASGASDAAVEAGPPPEAPAVRVGGLPALACGHAERQKSILLVAAGCMGAPGFVDTLDNVVCGIGYSPDKPTLAPVLVQLSRIKKIDRVGLSVVNAAIAGESVTVQSVAPPEAALPNLTVAQGVSVGENSPKPPNFAASKAGLGFGGGDPTLDVSAAGTASPALSVPWKNGLAPAGTGGVEEGETYAIVLLGPRVSVAVTKWWNPVGHQHRENGRRALSRQCVSEISASFILASLMCALEGKRRTKARNVFFASFQA